MRHPKRTFALTAPILVALAATLAPTAPCLAADGSYVLGRDDEEFALALARRGYPELAEEFVAILEKAGGSPAAKKGQGGSRIGSIRLEARLQRARSESDPEARRQAYLAIADETRKIAEEKAGTPEGDDALRELPGLDIAAGELCAQQIQAATDPAEQEKYREAGDEAFTRATTTLQRRLDAPPKGAGAPADDVDRMVARFDLFRAQVLQTLLHPEGSPRRKEIGDRAIRLFRDFELDYGDQILCFEGYVFMGLCHKAMGNLDEALSSFDDCIGLRDTYEKTSAGIYDMPQISADTVSEGIFQKMNLLSERKEAAAALALGADFAATIPNAGGTRRGLAILVATGEAQEETGDLAALEATAKKLVAADSQGPAGARGREWLNKGGSTSAGRLGVADRLKIADNLARSGRGDQAVNMLRQIINSLGADPKEQDVGAESGLLLGAIYARNGDLHEATVAWDVVAERFANGSVAAEAAWRALNAFVTLSGSESQKYYDNRAREKMTLLASKYPKHPSATRVRLVEGQKLENDGRFADAAALYMAVPADSPARDEALFRAGLAWQRQAKKETDEKKPAEAQKTYEKARDTLAKAREELDAAAAKSDDAAAKARLDGLRFGARVSLGNVLIAAGGNGGAEAWKLADECEALAGEDASRVESVWELRVKAAGAAGKLDEVVSLFDRRLRQDPSAKNLSDAAGSLAKLVDADAKALAEKDPSGAADLWKKAVTYYAIAADPKSNGGAAIPAKTLEPIANRLYALGLVLSKAPPDVQSFTDWTPLGGKVDAFEKAAVIYASLAAADKSSMLRVKLARVQGLLGKWDDSAKTLAGLFSDVKLVDIESRRVNMNVLRSDPALLEAILDWGIAEREAAKFSVDRPRHVQATKILEALGVAATAESKLWWKARTARIESLIDAGEYQVADVEMKALLRNYPNYDEDKFGCRERLVTARKTLDTKIR